MAIQNRRYLGSKYRLLPMIVRVVEQHCTHVQCVADIFAGTGVVVSAFAERCAVITNDLLYSNYICHVAWFSAQRYREAYVATSIAAYNALKDCSDNYMTCHFEDTYFSYADCARIGFIRNDIEQRFWCGEMNERERALLITALLYGIDRIAATCGHYDACRRCAEFAQTLHLAVPQTMPNLHPQNYCYQEDANQLVRRVTADLVYIDPPYNSGQYCDTYHLPENVARKMDRFTEMKSKYCPQAASTAFADLIAHTRARYILLSHNSMANKGNSWSNARKSDETIMHILSQKGEGSVFAEQYKPFTTGRSHITQNEERLFLCRCFPL